jgi:hypothetical protein
VTVTVYIVVICGLTTLIWEVTPLLQEYVNPPEAVSVVLTPAHIVVFPLIDAVGRLFTVTVAVSVSVQLLPSVTVTV